MVSTDKKEFLTNQVPELLKALQADAEPIFGLMTAQHMVEHLVWVTKSSLKQVGEPPAEPLDSHHYFRKFLSKGAKFKHRPKEGKTRDDLPKLKYNNLAEAVAEVPNAISRIYSTFADNPDYKSYNAMMGQFDFNDHELFNYEHYKWHLYQFGLLEDY